jgi:hypothetical protein
MTGEHVWPKWLKGRFPPAPKTVPHSLETTSGGLRQWGAPPFNQTVRDVCHGCNTGWMSDLEVATQPILEPLLAGQTTTLDENSQRILAAWGLKTAMMSSLVNPNASIFPSAHFRALYDSRLQPRPPDGSHVVVFRYGGIQWASYYRSHGLVLAFEGAEGMPNAPAHGATFTIGQLGFQIFGSELEGLGFDNVDGPLERVFLRQILPFVRPLTWPETPLLSDEQLVTLADRFIT